MRIRLTWATVALMLVAQAATAEVTLTGTAVSDYDFRGISQTSGNPALQLSIDYSGELFYASAWASNIDFDGTSKYGDGTSEQINTDGNIELDLVAGFAGETGGGIRWDAGGVAYLYPGSDEDLNVATDPDDDQSGIDTYYEVYVGGGYGPVDAKLWYSPDLYNLGDTAWYAEANASFPLPYEIGLNLHAGYNFGDYFDSVEEGVPDADYWEYSVGLARSWGHFDFEVKYIGNAVDSFYDVDDGPNRNDDRVIFSVATTYPWATDEE